MFDFFNILVESEQKITPQHTPGRIPSLNKTSLGAHRPCYYIVLWINHFPFVLCYPRLHHRVWTRDRPHPIVSSFVQIFQTCENQLTTSEKTLVRWNIRLNSDFDSAYFSHFFYFVVSLVWVNFFFLVAVVFFIEFFHQSHTLSVPNIPKASVSKEWWVGGGWREAGDGEHHCGTKNVNLIFFAMTANEASAAA